MVSRGSRNTCTPDVAIELNKIWWETDLRRLLPAVHAPTLLLADQPGYPQVRVVDVGALTSVIGSNVGLAQYVASLMLNAKLKVIQGSRLPTQGEAASYCRPILEAVQRHVGLEPPPVGIDSVLATVLFTDIVGSTERQAALGDLAWKELLEPTMPPLAGPCTDGVEWRSTLLVTGSSPRSTGRRAPSAALSNSPNGSGISGSAFEQVFTLASASRLTAGAVASP